jgi:hypothetical protein
MHGHHDAKSMTHPVNFSDVLLAAAQRATPMMSTGEWTGDIFESNEEVNEFIAPCPDWWNSPSRGRGVN